MCPSHKSTSELSSFSKSPSHGVCCYIFCRPSVELSFDTNCDGPRIRAPAGPEPEVASSMDEPSHGTAHRKHSTKTTQHVTKSKQMYQRYTIRQTSNVIHKTS